MIHYQTEKENKRLWLVEREFLPDYELKTESVFSQCNGYLGVRAAQPLSVIGEQRGMFLSGAFHRAYEEEVTELVNCPDVTWFELTVDGETLYPERSTLCFFERKMDLRSGELAVTYEFELKNGGRVQVENRRFASVEERHLLAQRFTVRMLEGAAEEVRIRTGINGQMTNSGVSHFQSATARVYEKAVMEIRGELGDNTVTEAAGCKVVCGRESQKDFALKRRSIYGTYKVAPGEDGCVRLEKMTYADQAEDGVSSKERQTIVYRFLEEGYEALFEAHRAKFESFWNRAGILVDGMTEEEEAAVCFAQYHIAGMTPWHTDKSSIAAKGLTGEGYKGHVFWDTEIFIFPMLLYSYPEEARRLLMFRYHGLCGARKKARDYGYEGAMFPWEAAKTGEEETPLYAALNIHTGKANKVWSGIKEYHVTADIAYAVEQYYEATRDQEFMEGYGYEMVFEAARFWVSCARWDEKRQQYGIFDVIGPDEYTEHVDNNAYTNYMAAYCVRMALGYAVRLREEAPEVFLRLNQALGIEKELGRWEAFLREIYLPKPGEDGIIPQDDTFLSKPCLEQIEKYKSSQIKQLVLSDYSREEVVHMQVLKQADVVMLLNLFPQLFDPETVRKNVLFYEERTIHDSSLSYCAHAQACAAIGAMDLAWDFFCHSLIVDLDENPHDSTDGIHCASLGGIWNCLIFGFAGVHYEDGVLFIKPHLPQHWKKMEFCMVVEGSAVRFSIARDQIVLTCEEREGAAILVSVGQKEYSLRGRLAIQTEERKQQYESSNI